MYICIVYIYICIVYIYMHCIYMYIYIVSWWPRIDHFGLFGLPREHKITGLSNHPKKLQFAAIVHVWCTRFVPHPIQPSLYFYPWKTSVFSQKPPEVFLHVYGTHQKSQPRFIWSSSCWVRSWDPSLCSSAVTRCLVSWLRFLLIFSKKIHAKKGLDGWFMMVYDTYPLVN